ncbi:unnamed protein product [Absidia cylindrospora]
MVGREGDWDQFLPAVQLAMNAQPVNLTSSAPFALMFARKLNTFKDYNNVKDRTLLTQEESIQEGRQEVSRRIKDMADIVIPAIVQRTREVRETAQRQFDKKHKIKDFLPGSLVGLKTAKRNKKNEPRYTGPYKVTRKNAGGAYILENMDGSRLNKHFPPSALKTISDNPDLEKDLRLVLEAILESRGDIQDKEYKVKWKGLGIEDATWEQESALDSHDIQKFLGEQVQRRMAIEREKADKEKEKAMQAEASKRQAERAAWLERKEARLRKSTKAKKGRRS